MISSKPSLKTWTERRAWIREHARESLLRDDRCWLKHPGGMQARVLPGHTVCRMHIQYLREILPMRTEHTRYD